MTAFKRSSNSPRYLAPAIRAPISNDISFLPTRLSGTSCLIIRKARPSAIAVLPTPGSPINTGLFFVRRDKTWTTRRISSSRPTTGSSFPSAAKAVRSRAYLFKTSYLFSGSSSVTFWEPRISIKAVLKFSAVILFFLKSAFRSASPPFSIASTKCSVDI
ncbi:hypothetical protein D3C87_1572500 [compost metagenome]